MKSINLTSALKKRMDKFYIPLKTIFNDKTINVLNIDSGLEFLADDIYHLIANTKVADDLLKFHCDNLPENFKRNRTVLIDGVLHKKTTLCWLALNYAFRQAAYKKQKEFAHWTRKKLILMLTSNESEISDVIATKVANIFSDFFKSSDKYVDSLSSIYRPNLSDSLCTSLSIIPSANNLPPEIYQLYLKLLKKELPIPDFHFLVYTPDLAAKLLRDRYLESLLIVLSIPNAKYFELYKIFVDDRRSLLLAQEMDIAVISVFKSKTPHLILQIIEGGFFLQSLLACTLAGIIDKSLSLQIKQAYKLHLITF